MKLNVSKIAAAYRVLGNASYEKMADDDKIKVWKIARELRPIAVKFEEDKADAQRKLIPDAEFHANLQKAQQYESMLKEGRTDLPMTTEEYQKFAVEFDKNMELMTAALKEFADEEIEVNIKPLTEEAFSKLMASNNWTLKQVDALEIIIEQ